MIEENILHLLQATLNACIPHFAAVTSVSENAMPGVGYSSAPLRRFDLQYLTNGGLPASISLVIKSASLVERRSMLYLFRQGHACIPFCHTLDLETDQRKLLCMEFIPGDHADLDALALTRAAQALAAIHARNLQSPALMDWLPPAGGTFIESGYVLGTFRPAWAQAMTDAGFRQEFGSFSADLETAAAHFVGAVEEIWQQGDSITLIHGDLHAGNVILKGSQPYFVDWEHARAGSFYLDLPNLFPGAPVRDYYQALLNCGVALDEAQFFARYREMGRYVGFKYMGFVLSHWPQRDASASWVRASLRNLVGLAIDGSPA